MNSESEPVERTRGFSGNEKKRILLAFKRELLQQEFRVNLYPLKGPDSIQWQLEITGRDVKSLIEFLPIQHGEKVMARNIVLTGDHAPWAIMGLVYKAFRESIQSERDRCVRAARRNYDDRENRKSHRGLRLEETTKQVRLYACRGLRRGEIAIAIGKSVRTVYRHLKRTLDRQSLINNAEKAE